MGFFRWLYRLPGRIDRNMEKTALAASVVEGEGMGGTQLSTQMVNAALARTEPSGAREEESDEAEGQ
jgi:hypothetical protein